MTTSSPTGAASTARPTARRAAEVAAPLAAAVTSLVAPLVVLGRLPDPVASHWSWRGVPDGSLPRLVDVGVLALVTTAVAIGPLLVARGAVPRDLARVLVAVAGAAGVLLAGLRIASVQANLDAPTWEAASGLPGVTLAATVLAALLAGAIGVWAAGDRAERAPESSPAAPVEIRPGEAIVWSGVATSPAGVRIGAAAFAAVALGAFLVPADARLILLGLLLLGAALAGTLGQVRVTVGPAGLTARVGAFGWPRVHVPIEEVASVRVEEVVPYEYGGWGYRYVPGATAVVIRKGPGLRVERREGRALVVTVDGAAEAAGVLLAHRTPTPGDAST